MYITFQLKDLQDKYTNLYPGVDDGTFPEVASLAYMVAELLKRHGHQTDVYDVATNGLGWRVSAPSVDPETMLCIWVGDILSPRDKRWYAATHEEKIIVSDEQQDADFVWTCADEEQNPLLD